MPVFADLNRFTAQTYETFDVKLVRRHVPDQSMLLGDATRRKHDDLPALRLAEIIRQPVHEQMIARADLHLDNLIALPVKMRRIQSRAVSQRIPSRRRFAKIRRKPDRVRFAAKLKILPEIEDF